MKRGITLYSYILSIGLSLQAAEDFTTIHMRGLLESITRKVKEESPALFVRDFGLAPFLSPSYINVLPLSDFLKLETDSQNIVSVFRSSHIGDTKRVGTNSKKYAVIGNPECFEACLDKNKKLNFIFLGSIKHINNPESRLQKVLEYIGHYKSATGQQKRSKASLAFQLAQEFDKENKDNEAELWYLRSIEAGNDVVASYHFAQLLDKKLSNFSFDERIASRRQAFSAVTKIYQKLAQEVGHLGSMRECASFLEQFGYFAEAARWYKKCVIEKGHISSIKNMVGCANMLWEPLPEDGATLSDDITLTSIKELYELAAYKFGDEESVNRLADFIREYGGSGYSLEREALIEQIRLCGNKVTSNTILRLALLDEKSYKMNHIESEIENHKIYEMFLSAAQAGNFPAMIKLYQLSLEEGCEDKVQFWLNKISRICNDILRSSKIKNSLLYVGYLGVLGQELLEDVYLQLDIKDRSFFEDDAYSFEPTVDPFIEKFSSEEEKPHKRKREEDEDCDPDTKRMRCHEFEQ